MGSLRVKPSKSIHGQRAADTAKRTQLPSRRAGIAKPVEIPIEEFEKFLRLDGLAQLREEFRQGLYSGRLAKYIERLVRDMEAEHVEYCTEAALRSTRRTETAAWATLGISIITLLVAL